MKQSLLACMLGTIFMLGGCAPLTESGGGGAMAASFVPSDCPRHFTKRPQYTCAGSTCRIRVQVVWNAATRTCEVQAENDKTFVSGVQGRVVRVEWELLSAPDWEFRDEAAPFAAPIMFKMPPQQPDVNFKKISVTGDKVVIDNLMANKGPFNHSIRVYHRRTNTGLEEDPALVNDY